MADPRFFASAGPFTVAELARISGAELAPGADGARVIADIAPLAAAGPGDLAFLDNARYRETFATSGAGACIVRADAVEKAPPAMALLISHTPYLAFARAARAFYPRPQGGAAGVAATASVALSATLGRGCRVDAGAVIGERVEIGARTWIGANAVIGDGVVLGEDCVVGALASLSHALVGDRVTILPGARIGQEGFGFATEASGAHLRIPQVGRVRIGDDVEIGANTTIDRGSSADTIIGDGCMIDNLVQIAHNVHLGRGCVLVGQVGISGSTRLGDFVVCGGQVGLAGHLTIGDRAVLAARAGVMHDLAAGGVYGGAPAVPLTAWKRQTVALARLAKERGRH